MKRNTISCFWSKIYKTDSCWNWIMGKSDSGYGRFSYNGKTVRAHRFSYELHNGKIPFDKEIDHLCRNRLCCNPEHLEAVNHLENVRRGEDGFLQKSKTHCPKGHEYSGINLYIRKNGWRNCKECKREAVRKYRSDK
mgnify:FL=1